MDKHEVFIPFPGFYESWVDGLIDDHLEDEAEHFGINIYPENYRINFEGIAKEYVKFYANILQEKLEDEGRGDLKVDLQFKELISPRFYNFETDRILCTVDDPMKLHAVYDVLCGDMERLNRDIQERFRSRDGFASFYNDFANNWMNKPMKDWDCNELSVLLPEFDMEDFELFHEVIMDHVEVTHPSTDPEPTG